MNLTSRTSKLVLLVIVLLGGYFGLFPLETTQRSAPPVATDAEGTLASPAADSGDEQIERAFADRRSDLQVRLSGRVERVLPDDLEGSRHQRFILRLATGRTLLVAHNIDLAPRVAGLAENDRVELYGEYEWNRKGGVIHWTHRDPRGNHPHGWIKHKGRRYE